MRPNELIEQGTAHHKAGRLREAEACYRQVLEDDPEHAGALHLLGLVAKHAGDPATAVHYIERALARKPAFAEAHYNLGSTRWQRGELDEAVACYDRSLGLDAERVDAWVNKGRTLQQLGRRAEAAEAFRAALRLAPDSGKAWENLGLTGPFAADDPEVEAMQAALGRVDPRGEDGKCLHFALAKARSEQGATAAAFGHYMAGNAIARTQRPYNIAKDEQFFTRIAAQFPAARIARLRGHGAADARPIFVLGMPRSGTTLSTWEVLSKTQHRDRFWQRPRGYHHAADRGLVPLTARELSRAVGAFPIAFQSDPPRLVAVLGLWPDRNAFVDGQGRWRGGYVPAHLRCYPFRLVAQGPQNYQVVVDTASEALQADRYTGDPLFTAEGEATEAFQPVLDFLRQLAQAQIATDQACQALAEHGLLSAWQPKVQVGDQTYRLTGLAHVDEQQLNACSGETLVALREAGALSLAYAQLLSQGQLKTLAQQAEARAREAKVPGAEQIFGEPDLEARIDWDALDLGDDEGQGG